MSPMFNCQNKACSFVTNRTTHLSGIVKHLRPLFNHDLWKIARTCQAGDIDHVQGLKVVYNTLFLQIRSVHASHRTESGLMKLFEHL